VQQLRKKAGLNAEEKVSAWFEAGAEVTTVVTSAADMIDEGLRMPLLALSGAPKGVKEIARDVTTVGTMEVCIPPHFARLHPSLHSALFPLLALSSSALLLALSSSLPLVCRSPWSSLAYTKSATQGACSCGQSVTACCKQILSKRTHGIKLNVSAFVLLFRVFISW
jgi:hypothetical protein